ncbi:hypothetical protein [Cupriavidus pinatubonensis]|uniref:Phage integrase n=1 Tax=Cupriavidus pinatubonensis TaxID=248026 RepID=A0ABM8WTN1_9BURK|nr:hypothetical protein [Cupriavidus pinatubonensis]CAG9170834.1 hypothetical protein LMG23994_02019 [Cupriavidus pinatubonensis]
MTISLMEMGFQIASPSITPNQSFYRPIHWPPPADWVVSLDAQDHPLSRWGDSVLDFSAWVGKTFKLDFAGGRHNRSAPKLGPENQYVMRLLTTWLIWGPRGPKSWNSSRNSFYLIRRIVSLCENEGVLASELERFPKVIDKIHKLFQAKKERETILLILDRLRRGIETLGICLLNEEGLRILSKSFSANPCAGDEETVQTAYIPPRIWTYQNLRLRACLDDFLMHSEKVEECYHFCVDAYAYNFGSLEAAVVRTTPSDSYRPFAKQKDPSAVKRGENKYYGPFMDTAQKFCIAELIKRWIKRPKAGFDIRSLGSYLTLVQMVAITYIANFTLQRIEEASGLRSDCLIWDEDPTLGNIPIIRGETTKTDPDSDARWPTSPSVEVAVNAASFVAKMRMRCIAANPHSDCSEYDKANPLLFHYSCDPWGSSSRGFKPYVTQPMLSTYQNLLKRFPLLLDEDVLRITEDELATARMFTPNLDKDGKFKAGSVWVLAYHQLRRTGGVNMFASGLLSDTSIQVIMKHLTLHQTRYYGKNHSRLRFNEEVEGLTTTAKYDVMAKQIEAIVSERYVSPLGAERKQEVVVNLVSDKDFKALVKAGKKGEISFRETRLGGCTKRGHCDYGGIESISRCAGGDGAKPCRDAVYDREKASSAERHLKSVEHRLEVAQPESPRKKALEAEAQGLRNYLNVVRN